MKKTIFALATLTGLFAINACKKDPVVEPNDVPVVTGDVYLNQLSLNVIQSTYNDLATNSEKLYVAIEEFNTSSSEANLTVCKTLWKATRQCWEQSEGFLFGPVATGNIDPRIDTWPVNYVDLDSVLNNGPKPITATYVDGLEDALKGFHPVEYLLFGKDGSKTATQLTDREKEYLIALADNLRKLTKEASSSWNPANADNYSEVFTKPGNDNKVYKTSLDAYTEVVNAMAGICDEVANGKMEEPLAANDPSLEESPFAQNSIKDFTNNIISVQNVYLGKYAGTDGAGLDDVIKENNLAL
ncbi:MAG TPA: imelysin family protein, partial [Bacteroidia bacterium]|nr:imelysin family protein [Bacteroidia bacterium]